MKLYFWHGESMKDVARIDCFFNDLECYYSGNMFDKSGKAIGDFYTKNSLEIEKCFSKVFTFGK